MRVKVRVMRRKEGGERTGDGDERCFDYEC